MYPEYRRQKEENGIHYRGVATHRATFRDLFPSLSDPHTDAYETGLSAWLSSGMDPPGDAALSLDRNAIASCSPVNVAMAFVGSFVKGSNYDDYNRSECDARTRV